MGDPRANLEKAIELLNDTEGIEVTAVAPFYRTAPVGYTEQDYFINTVAEINTSLSPLQLLEKMQQIENKLGRVRVIRWGPRTVDLDLLLYGDEKIAGPDLEVPHPRMHQRAFVMVPLADLNPQLVIQGEQAADLARRLAGEQEIIRV
ncbi:2-amino-4-hydroxy-6-hydroxymethyldihydropteridine diphosphokinase [Desulfallas sp. Bu1-1]|jgi:2-amino-4-hydroxy-6-hydroxymethyldihydropteridine diphosphokinase|nr:2-amino-4-hydroxy-6-hydroxymethyldihydropteridine diphosphokinase [Desulfallas sp. Bu1-1]